MRKFTSLLLVLIVGAMCSCSSTHLTMKDGNTRVEFNKSDFTLSDQVSGEATETKVIGIDWARLFIKKTGSNGGVTASSIPLVGGMLESAAQSYAVYNMMEANKGYDVVFYPQYETKTLCPVIGICFLTKITTVKATARLGKL